MNSNKYAFVYESNIHRFRGPYPCVSIWILDIWCMWTKRLSSSVYFGAWSVILYLWYVADLAVPCLSIYILVNCCIWHLYHFLMLPKDSSFFTFSMSAWTCWLLCCCSFPIQVPIDDLNWRSKFFLVCYPFVCIRPVLDIT